MGLERSFEDHRFSKRSRGDKREMVISRMQRICGASGHRKQRQTALYDGWRSLCGARRRAGERRSRRQGENKANVAPASSQEGQRKNYAEDVTLRFAPRSCEASRRGRGMCSRAA